MGYKNLDHLSSEEVDFLHQRYLKEKSTDLIKEYHLEPKRKNDLYSMFPLTHTEMPCILCSDSLKFLPAKKGYKSGVSEIRAACETCGHKQYYVEGNSIELQTDEDCNCDYCTNSKDKAKEYAINAKRTAIIKQYGDPVPSYISFMDVDSVDSLSRFKLHEVTSLMSLIFAKWDESVEDNLITAVERDDAANIYPIDVGPIITACYHANLIAIEICKTNIDNYVENDNGTLSFYHYQVPYKSNLIYVDEGGEKPLTIKDVYEWYSRKFSDRFWDALWDEQLLTVWVDLAVDECISYAILKAEEYSFGFQSETKLREIIRELLQEFSVSECYYFISSAYFSAAAFYQSNKASSRRHAENTVPGKILSIAKSGNLKQWDRPADLPRTVYSQILFDIVLGLQGDYGFNHCPHKAYSKLLTRPRTEWPSFIDDQAIQISGEYGYVKLEDALLSYSIVKSDDSLNTQLSNLYAIANFLGLEKAASAIFDSFDK